MVRWPDDDDDDDEVEVVERGDDSAFIGPENRRIDSNPPSVFQTFLY